MTSIDYYLAKNVPLDAGELSNLIADVDERLLDPIKFRPYFSSYADLAKRFIENGHIIYAKHSVF